MIIILHLLSFVCYLAAWRAPAFFVPATLLHATTLFAHYAVFPRFDFGIWLSVFMLAAAVLGWWNMRRLLSRGILLGFATVAMFLPMAIVAHKPPPPLLAWLHIIPAILAYAAVLLSLLRWLDLLYAERAQRRLAEYLTPPLLTLEAECFATIKWAFILLTITVISGATISGGVPLHKLLFAILSWLAFGGLLAGRQWRGWRGVVAKRWLLTAVIFFILSYFGTHFVLQIILGR